VKALGWMILGSIAHATGFAVIGAVAYLAWRRWSPAAGALAASSSPLIMALVSMIVPGPWPRWWSLSTENARQSPAAVTKATAQSNQTAQSRGRDELAPEHHEAGEAKALS
jgi:hypothetical protein